ncbi:MAG: DNA-directed RNA polymerase subunit N [Nitrososphaerota archaeon]
MIIPVRCFTCGNLIADKYQEYVSRVKAGEEPGKVLDSLGLRRYCCRRMLISNFSIADHVLPYYEAMRQRRAASA